MSYVLLQCAVVGMVCLVFLLVVVIWLVCQVFGELLQNAVVGSIISVGSYNYLFLASFCSVRIDVPNAVTGPNVVT